MIERDFLKGNTLEQIEDLARRVGDLERAVSLGLFQQDQTLAAPGRISVPAGAAYQVAGQPLLGQLVAPFLALPGLRGLWPMSAFDAAGNAQDVSGHGHHLTLIGNPVYGYDGLVPYIELVGVGDYLRRNDEADLDILGTESYVEALARGLTVAGWFWFANAPASTEFAIAKRASSGGYSWGLFRYSSGLAYWEVSGDGVDVVNVGTTEGIRVGNWAFLAGRFVPGSEISIWYNEARNTLTTAVPGSLFNTDAQLTIGARNVGSNPMAGRVGPAALYAEAASDDHVLALYQQTRGFFGV